MSPPALELEGLVVRFGPVVALDDVSLEVAAGEVVAVVGPSGCGKSTLLRVVAGLQRPDAGRVAAGGRDLGGVPAHRRGIGLMFQQHALFPQRDVAANVAFGLGRAGAPREEVADTVDRMLELVGLTGFGRRRISELSGGEQQRVALARALAPAPSVLLLDEPLGALDASLRTRLARDLGRVITELGLTVVAVTHDRDEAFALSDRIAVMDEGRILRSAPPAELWADPQHRRVAELLQLGTILPDGSDWRLVRPDAVVLGVDGPTTATVTLAVFQGASTSLELVLDDGGGTLRCDVPSADAPPRGARVAYELDPAGVQHLA